MVLIPTVIERNHLSERSYDLYSCLLKERVIILTGEINDQVASSICAQLLYLSSISNEDIQMYINSPGGSVSAGLAIYDTMQYIKCDISTICMGICASMAAILLCAGSEKKRYALANSEVMIHQPLGEMAGQAKDLEIAASHIIEVKKKLYQILSSHTNQPLEKVAEDCDRDYFLNAESAMKYGLVDDVLSKQIAS